MSMHHLAYAEQSAPRYTSYPTAPHFNESVDGKVFGEWLGALPADSKLSLYIHIPYCRDICWYCGCHTYATHRDGPLANYVHTLMSEIEIVASVTAAARVDCIHWGGGTPNILPADSLRRLFRYLELWFDLGGVREHGIEMDPRYVTAEQAAVCASLGVTYASLGVQDFNAQVQNAIGRIQPYDKVASAVEHLRSAGVRNLGMDLMYGLPQQTLDDARHSARLAAEFGPDRIAVFGYAHVPWLKSRQRLIDAEALPGARLRMEQQAAMREEFDAAGYVAVGLDHYAKPKDALARAARSGTLSRNFHGYVERDRTPLIGLGASAISTLPQGYAQNPAVVRSWNRAIAANCLPTVRGHALTGEDRRRGKLIEALLCQFTVDLSGFGGSEAFANEMQILVPLARDGLVIVRGDRITIPPKARPLARLVAEVFDAYRHVGAARHSRAV